MLQYLVAHPETTISRETLLATVWSGRIVSDTTIATAIKNARQALGDDGARQRYIKTVQGRGYRFIGKNIKISESSAVPSAIQTKKESSPSNQELPVLLVLPFSNLSRNPEHEILADGFTDDIGVELSRFRSLSVIGRSVGLAIKSANLDLQMIKEDYGVAYLVEGSVRLMGDRIRVTAQLNHARNGENVWSQKYDREVSDLFTVQDEITRSIVATIGVRLDSHQIQTKQIQDSTDWNSYQLILKAQSLHHRVVRSANFEAKSILDRLVKEVPHNSRAHSLLGTVEVLNFMLMWSEDAEQSLKKAIEHGSEAVRLDASDSLAHARYAESLIYVGQFADSKRHFETAVSLNPNDSEALVLYSVYYIATGELKTALEMLESAWKMDPFERNYQPWIRAEALFFAERYAEAIETLNAITEPINEINCMLAGCYAGLGETDKARTFVQTYLAIAKKEMPEFPGDDFNDWIPVWKSGHFYENSKQTDLRIELLSKCWP